MKFHLVEGQSVRLNCSKSMLLRQLMIVFLRGERLPKLQDDDSEDAKILHSALEKMLMAGSNGLDYITLDVKDCGAAYRFLLAAAAVTPGHWQLTGTSRLLERPIQPLVDSLRSIGAEIESMPQGWRINGKNLKANEMEIDCTQSSQFASALWLIGERLGLRQLKTIPTPLPSSPYIELTKKMLAQYQMGMSFQREGDWSTTAVWYAFLAGQSHIHSLILKDLRLDSLQGDTVVAQWFLTFGVKTASADGGIRISRFSPSIDKAPIHFNLLDHPDLAPVLAVCAILCHRHVTLSGLSTLNHKESRRLDRIAQALSPFAIIHQQGDDTLEIAGETARKPEVPVALDTAGDHRLAMAFALLSLQYDVTLSDIGCVRKSYPAFTQYFGD